MNLHIIARGMKTDLTLLLNVFRLVAILCNVAWYPHLFHYLECLTTNHVEALGGFTTIGKNILLIICTTLLFLFYPHIHDSKRKCVRERRCDGYEYRSKRDCISHCKTNPPTQITNSDICHLPPMRPEFKGVECRASIPKWTYSTRFVWFFCNNLNLRYFILITRSMKCRKYLYGGCGASENSFNSEIDCVNKCAPRPPPPPRGETNICKLPPIKKSRGNLRCRARMERWTYDYK